MSDFPYGDSRCLALQTKWVEVYTDFVTSVLGLRSLQNTGAPLGVGQTLMAAKIRHLLELSDELNSCGSNPTLSFAGEETDLWLAAMNYGTAGCWEALARPIDLTHTIRAVEESHHAWGRFIRVVAGLSADFGNSIPALDPSNLRPERLERLFQPRIHRPLTVGDEARQPVAQQFDEPVLR